MTEIEKDWFLKEWLQALKLRQADLADLTGYAKGRVSELVTGKQRYNRDILNAVAAALELAPHELLQRPEDVFAEREVRNALEAVARLSERRQEFAPDGR